MPVALRPSPARAAALMCGYHIAQCCGTDSPSESDAITLSAGKNLTVYKY